LARARSAKAKRLSTNVGLIYRRLDHKGFESIPTVGPPLAVAIDASLKGSLADPMQSNRSMPV